jgi:radical SAM-linked protein
VARSPEGPPPPPAVQRIRLRYAKRGRLRFSSHRDFQRAIERALRRTAVPMAYTAGFNPHPRVSYANAAPTGAASEAEYLEIALSRRCDVELIRAALDQALPDGLDVVQAVEAQGKALADRLQASIWSISLPGAGPELERAVELFLAADRVEVKRMTKAGIRTFDARAAIALAKVDLLAASSAAPACAILQLVVRHATPAVRPDDVLTALHVVADFAPPSSPLMTRLAQGPLDDSNGSVADPLAVDEDFGGASTA